MEILPCGEHLCLGREPNTQTTDYMKWEDLTSSGLHFHSHEDEASALMPESASPLIFNALAKFLTDICDV